MRAAAAGAITAAVLLAPGCADDAPAPKAKEEPVRRAAFRSLAARDFLLTCPAGAERRETRYHAGRFDELKQLAARKGAGNAVWLGENDWAAVSRYGEREACESGEEAYTEALAAYSAALDRLAGAIAEYRR